MVTKGLWDDLLKVEGLEQAEETMNDLHSILRFIGSKGRSAGKTGTTKTGKNTTDYGL